VVKRVEQRLGFLGRCGIVQIGLALPLQCGDGWKVSAPGGGQGHVIQLDSPLLTLRMQR
jgi:hypothetical protein